MTPRERILHILEGKQPDFVPFALFRASQKFFHRVQQDGDMLAHGKSA